MLHHLIYGKVILDALRLSDGRVVPEALGGGGPQALWGAALWSDSVGFLSRCGTDLPATAAAALAGIGVDLAGVARYDDLPTLRGPMLVYDEKELMRDERGEPVPRARRGRCVGSVAGAPPRPARHLPAAAV